MANVSSADRSTTFGDFDTTANTSAITVGGSVLVDMSLDFGTGSGAGTVILQRKTRTAAAGLGASTWQDIASYTTDTEKTIQSAVQRQYRLAFTVSSGSIAFELAGGNRVA